MSFLNLVADQLPKREREGLRVVAQSDVVKPFTEKANEELKKQIEKQPFIQKIIESEKDEKLYNKSETEASKVEPAERTSSDEPDLIPSPRQQDEEEKKTREKSSSNKTNRTPHQGMQDQKGTKGKGYWSTKYCFYVPVVCVVLLSFAIGIYVEDIKELLLKPTGNKISSLKVVPDDPRLQPLGDDKLTSVNHMLQTVQDDYEGNKKNVLFLSDEWGTSKGGISSVNRQLALQAKNAGYAVYVTVLDRPSEEDQKDAEENGIKLIIADTIPDIDQNINLNMLNNAHQRYFPSLEKHITNLNVIVGHVPITSKGALGMKQNRFPNSKVFLFTHVIPDETDFHKHGYFNLGKAEEKVENIKRQAEQADVVFSVGPKVYKQFKNTFRSSAVPYEKHKEFIPIPDENFFNLDLKPFSENDAYEILSVGRVSNVANLKGYDIVAAALGGMATKRSMFDDMLRWRIRGISDKDVNESIAFIMNNLEKVNGKLLKLLPMLYGTQKQVSKDIQESRLFLMPSRTEPFGMVGLEAIAAGIPVLVTANSGLAYFLKEHFPKHMHDSMIVSKLGKTDIDIDGDIAIWEDRITDVLFNKYNDTFDLARQVKGKLIEFKYHPKSQIFKNELKKLK
ncbi:uncharacterized protein [Ptychodera flava]|uniref:uncharacterized protein n=1 Tax=Ptychodera flava TaxID=63121 RepID=UPI003969E2FB